jgi:hypothetical protein
MLSASSGNQFADPVSTVACGLTPCFGRLAGMLNMLVDLGQ